MTSTKKAGGGRLKASIVPAVEVGTDNQAYLNARLGLGEAPLVPYKNLNSALDRAGRGERTGRFIGQGQEGDFELQESHRTSESVA